MALANCISNLSNDVSPWVLEDLNAALANRGKLTKKKALAAYIDQALADMRGELEDIYDDLGIDAKDPVLDSVRESPMRVTGHFGPLWPGFENDPEGAIEHLLKKKDGEVADAFIHPEVGPIAFVYGTHKMGIRHILEKRGREFLSRVPDLLRNGRVEKDQDGLPRTYIVSADDPAHVAVIRLEWDRQQKTWLMTAYNDDEGKFAGGGKTADTPTATASEVPADGEVVFSQESGKDNITPTDDGVKESTNRTLAADLDEQATYLADRAEQAGYKDIDDWAANDIAGYIKAAEEWRDRNPAEVLESPYRAVDTESAEFKWWFKGSKVVDADGKPLVVYHGTDQDFDEFNPKREGVLRGLFGGSFFTPSQREASTYADERALQRGGSANVMPVYLSLQNPKVLGRGTYNLTNVKSAMEGDEYDGVIVKTEDGDIQYVITKRSTQIKSAISNTGEFSDTNPDIRETTVRSQPFDLPNETKLDAFRRNHQDALIRWEKVQKAILEQGGEVGPAQNVYQAMRRYPGRAGEMLTRFTADVVEPLMKKVAAAKLNLDDIGTYLYALHAKDRNAYIQSIRGDMPDNGSGMTNAEADQALRDYRARADFKTLDKLAREFQAITAMKQQFLVDNGVWSQDQVDAMNNAMGQFYVPLKGFEKIDEAGNRGNGTGAGYSTAKRVGKKAYGRVSKAGQIVENIIRDFEQAVIIGEKAHVGRYVERLIEKNQDDTLWTVEKLPLQPQLRKNGVVMMPAPFDTEKEIRFIRDGKEVRIQLHDDLLLRAYNNLGSEQLESFLRASAALNSFLRQSYTSKNPAFFLINPIRDLQTSALMNTAEYGAGFAWKALKEIPSALRAAWAYERNDKTGLSAEWQAVLDAYAKNGSKTGAAFLDTLEAKQLKLQELLNRHGGLSIIDEWKTYGAKNAVKLALFKTFNNSLFDIIEHINGAFENMTRLATFKAYIDANGGISKKSGKVLMEATRLARSVTVDFNIRGEQSKNLNALYLFWNANVQGTANIIRAASQGKERKQLWYALGGLVALGLMLSLMGDDDDETLTPDHIKQRNLVFNLLGFRQQIPMPYGFSWFVDFGRLLGDVMTQRQKPGEASLALASSFLANFSPLGDSLKSGEGDAGDMALSIIPTALKPIAMSGFNIGAFGGQLYPEYPGQEDAPDRLKMWRGTRGTIYDWFSNQIIPWADISPETLKNIVSYTTGGAGKFVTDTVGAVAAGAKGDFDVEKTPIASKFIAQNDVEEYKGRFFTQLERLKKYKLQEKEIIAEMKAPGLTDADRKALQARRGFLIRKHGKELALYSDAESTRKKISAVANQMVEARMAGDTDKMKALEQQQINIAKLFNQRYLKLKDRQTGTD